MKKTNLIRLLVLLGVFIASINTAWADNGDFYNMCIKYSFEGGDDVDVEGDDNNTGVSTDAGTLTSGSLTLTGIYLKCWDDWGANYKSSGGQLWYTNKGGSNQYINSGFTRSGKNGNNYEYQNSSPGLTIASYNEASGSYAFECWGQTWGWGDRYFPKSQGHYVINYKIAPPAVNGGDFTITSPYSEGGTGEDEDHPMLITNGRTTATFIVTASKAHTDANSVLCVSFDNGSNWSTGANASATTVTSGSKTVSSDVRSFVVKVKFRNSSDATLESATTVSKTFYYKEQPAGIYITAGSNGQVGTDGNTWSSSAEYSPITLGNSYSIYAKANSYYHFVDWETDNENSTIADDDDASTTISVTSGAVTNVTANFAETMSTLSTACSYNVGNPSYSAPSVSGSATTVGRITTRTITAASPSTGYRFTGWTITNGARTDGGGETANPITVRSNGDGETVTVTANYAEDLTSPWTLKGGTNLTGNNWSTAYAMTKKTGHSTESVAYYTLNITSTNSGISGSADNWSFKLNNGSWYGLAADGDSYWWTSSTSANQPLSTSGKNIQLCPNALGEYEVKVDWSSGNKVTVSFPTAYAVNFSRGTVIGTNGSVSATYSSVAFSSGTKVQSGKTVTLTAPAAKEGYTYRGWYSTNTADPSSPATNRYTDNSSYSPTVSAAITAYACYTINNHTITHSDASHGSYTIKVGDASAVSTNTTSDYNKTITLSATADDGYHFTGWTVSKAGGGTVTPSSSASANPATFSMPDDNVTITATFAANTYTITLDDNGGGSGSGSATVSFDNNNYSVSPVTVPTRTGYIFGGYFGDGVYFDEDTQLIDEDGAWIASAGDGYYTDASKNWVYVGNKTIYAKWTPISFTIRYNANGGTGSMDDQTAQYEVENTLDGKNSFIDVNRFTAPTGYIYSPAHPWNTSADGTGTDIDAATYQSTLTSTNGATVNLYAQWSGRFALKANYDGGVDGYFRIHYNTSIIETLNTLYPTRYGYLCDGYYTTDEDGTKVLNGDGTVVEGNVSGYVTGGKWTYKGTQDFYAYWSQIKYDLTFDGNDCAAYVGTATGSKASMDDVEYEEMVDLTPGTLARTGYTFAGWSKTACATSPTYVMDSWNHISATDGDDVTLYAVWTPITYTISFNGQGAYYVGESSRPIRFGDDYGTRNGYTSSLPTALRTGYDFQGWYTRPNGAGTHITDETQLTTAADHTLYAHWTKANRVYFYNNMGWENVYVTWDATWNYENADKGAGSMGKTQEAMTHIYGTNVWYKDIPSSVLASWKYNIAFTSVSMPDYANFDKGQAVFRRDFDSDATMFVPKPNDEYKYTKNKHDDEPGTVYYSTAQEVDHNDKDEETNYRYQNGYWIRYEQLQSAYTVKGSWAWDDDHYVERYSLNDSVYLFTIRNLEANHDYYFNLYKHCTTSNNYSSVFKANSNITSVNCTDMLFSAAYADNSDTKITTTVAGDYTFKFLFSKLGEVKLTVEYPCSVGDYKVVSGWNDGSAKTFDSEVIRAKASTKDTISVFVHHGQSPTLTIQKCTGISAGVATWANIATGASINLGDVTKSGVYNFEINQPASGDPTGSFIEEYDGEFYIRTDSAHGGWDFYKQYPENRMTYSQYSMTQTLSAPFSHYYCRYYSTHHADITFAVATDYSPNISGVMIGDDMIGGVGNRTLPEDHPANIRFYWNHETNAMGRSYLKSAQGSGNKRYLVLHGYDNKLLDASGNTIAGEGAGADQIHANEILLGDSANWVYGIKIQAQPGAKVSLIAKYNGVDRYLIGGADSYETILGGEGTGKYEMKVVYDFKTNRLMTAWVPTLGGITDQLVDVDVMIERQYQGGGSTITFTKATEESEPGSLTAKRIIGALKMDYTDLVGNVASWTPTTRAKLMYFVSFPFDVNVSDIFGLNSAYGEAYVVQFYNGAKRAEKGFFEGDGTTTFWEDMPADSIMYANQGYCVVLDNEYFNGDIGNIWENKTYGGSVYLYFPSASREIGAISSSTKTITLPTHECKINRTFNGGKLNHKFTDSNWNIMGIPIFQNHTGDATAGTPGAIFTHDKAPTDTTGFDEFGYFYQWATDKSYTVTSAVGFTFLPMHSYMVQYAGNVSFTGAGPDVPASVAPRRIPMEENYKMELQVLNANEEMLNRTYVELRENAVDSFALNEDLFMVTNKHAVNVYTYAGTYDVSANVMSIDNHIIPMGVIVNQAGTYTFTMPSNFSGTVTLIDTQADTRTNLALSDYTVTLQKGTFNERFFLEIDLNQAPTAIDGVEGGSLKDGNAHKFIENGVMYILRDGNLYDARGNRVK